MRCKTNLRKIFDKAIVLKILNPKIVNYDKTKHIHHSYRKSIFDIPGSIVKICHISIYFLSHKTFARILGFDNTKNKV